MIETNHIFTTSGDEVTKVFNIPHGLPRKPYSWNVKEASDDACYSLRSSSPLSFNVTATANFLVVTYCGTSPDSGTDNLSWTFSAMCH